MIDKNYLRNLEYQITGACIEVHKILGPGLFESIYHKCLCKELSLRGISYLSEMVIGVEYKGSTIDTELRADLFIEQCIVLELKAIETTLPIHEAQILTYMKILEAPKGILINFNCINLINDGKKSFVNSFYRDLLD
ncbi:MAG: GxxExxY protein [Bacteroidota bacterium]